MNRIALTATTAALLALTACGGGDDAEPADSVVPGEEDAATIPADTDTIPRRQQDAAPETDTPVETDTPTTALSDTTTTSTTTTTTVAPGTTATSTTTSPATEVPTTSIAPRPPSTTTAPPTVPPTTATPAPPPPPPVVSYKNCDAVRAAGAAPIRAGDRGWDKKFDRDGDGVGCE